MENTQDTQVATASIAHTCDKEAVSWVEEKKKADARVMRRAHHECLETQVGGRLFHKSGSCSSYDDS